MPTDAPYLLDQLEAADMLEIDGLHAGSFVLNEPLLDDADMAAEADQPFASEDVVLTIECIDGRERRAWRFSYNQVMEAEYRAEDDSWSLGDGKHRLRCLGALAVGEPD
ncbi:DUF5629 family protein [Stutzerimonas marianensis]|uniref:DUF5629 family protein n=1 Tax=Stutzerimonas marianensis TaxID=2929513 RepID=A0A9X2ASA6_9GAMM|nr:DUF5629 family protein [Pseudomonas marianensis]MCJ0973475.1 DUF5629 family protein [Pseudomonas marianensis]